MVDWILITLLIALPILFAISGQKKKEKPSVNKSRFYLKDTAFSLLVLSLFWVLDPSIYQRLNFLGIGKGFNVNEEILSAIVIFFIAPFFLSLMPWNNVPKDILSAKELFGFPTSYLPRKNIEFILFILYIIIGVIFEELICRQFLFYSFNKTFNLHGDSLVLLSSFLFAVGHFYQGWKGLLSNFIIGLVLGKIFLLRETILYPIILHLFLNLTIVSIAYRRLKQLKAIERTPATEIK